MRRLVLISILAVVIGATAPAWAIHDPSSGTFVPAGDCAAAGSEAVGHPAAPKLTEKAGQELPNPGNSEIGLANNKAVPNCANAP